MIARPPFVVVLTAPAAGVGQSTLASNLAVYLKGLAEDLPVAYVSSDPAAGEAMFALPGCRGGNLGELQRGGKFQELLALGEFGVQFCPVGSLDLAESPAWLRRKLTRSNFDGVLLLDMAKGHPLLQAALWAADMVLVPVKDPAVLGEVVALRGELKNGGGSDEQFWLLPSELGAEGHYQRSARVTEFLRFAAQERGFQVLEDAFVVDSRVREQAAEKAKPILTRVPQSPLHQWLRRLAELVLSQRQKSSNSAVRVRRWRRDGELPVRAGRVDVVCPLCQRAVFGANVHYLESVPARQRILLHQSCLACLLRGTGAAAFMQTAALLRVQPAVASGGRPGELRLQVLSEELELLGSELLSQDSTGAWAPLLRRATGRHPAELYREQLLFSPQVTVDEALDRHWYQNFATLRGRLRYACREEKI